MEFSPFELRTITPESLMPESCPIIFWDCIPSFRKTVQSNLFCARRELVAQTKKNAIIMLIYLLVMDAKI